MTSRDSISFGSSDQSTLQRVHHLQLFRGLTQCFDIVERHFSQHPDLYRDVGAIDVVHGLYDQWEQTGRLELHEIMEAATITSLAKLMIKNAINHDGHILFSSSFLHTIQGYLKPPSTPTPTTSVLTVRREIYHLFNTHLSEAQRRLLLLILAHLRRVTTFAKHLTSQVLELCWLPTIIGIDSLQQYRGLLVLLIDSIAITTTT
ncbi:putative Rho GAP [Giardia muris]|uniref:Putative Rho GAP n=1 Tax=Giardia muris TaxID=5742 RepID=A0A4Z1ST52_GIAMU|nr:putative Rho GAP [Giardia muris]|eukprot:TNJ28930.1 putative Rho GAP [Giardia muris]